MDTSSNEQQSGEKSCKHQRTQTIAKDNQAEYLECLNCGAILDSEELTKSDAPEPEKIDESLSDA